VDVLCDLCDNDAELMTCSDAIRAAWESLYSCFYRYLVPAVMMLACKRALLLHKEDNVSCSFAACGDEMVRHHSSLKKVRTPRSGDSSSISRRSISHRSHSSEEGPGVARVLKTRKHQYRVKVTVSDTDTLDTQTHDAQTQPKDTMGTMGPMGRSRPVRYLPAMGERQEGEGGLCTYTDTYTEASAKDPSHPSHRDPSHPSHRTFKGTWLDQTKLDSLNELTMLI
jgi:hypothetical protein